MNPCNRTRSNRLRTYTSLIALPSADLYARPSTTREVLIRSQSSAEPEDGKGTSQSLFKTFLQRFAPKTNP